MEFEKGSLLRYPGGKQRILKWLLNYLPDRNTIKGKYFEPFVGGAAVFLRLSPDKAILSDINPELVSLYKGIRLDPQELWEIYKSFPEDKDGYYKVRDSALNSRNIIYKAARTLYINRTCFKGMWRHNSQGNFNVGYGGESRRWKICLDDLINVSNILQNVAVICSDFGQVVNHAVKGDFIFLDPPYSAGKDHTAHKHYVHGAFNQEDQIRLSEALIMASKKGVRWAMTNSGHEAILNLYQGYTVRPIGDNRSCYQGQVLIYNY